MKNIIFTFLVVIGLRYTQAYSQWQVQNSGFTSDISSLWVTDTNTAYALTIFNVLKTTNGGTDWFVNLNQSTYFDDVSFIDANTGFIIGRTISGATVFRTTDAGTRWEIVGKIPAMLKFSMCFVNPNVGYTAAFGGIYRTTNGGVNWVNLYNGSSDFADVFFVNVSTGWGTTNIGNILKTTNGGISWSGLAATFGHHQYGLFFLNENTGWLTAEGGLVSRSTNAGWIPWTTHGVGMPDCILTSVFFVNGFTGWAAGCQGSIHVSYDGGVNWSLQTIGLASVINDLKFANELTGWAVGTSGRILKTTNGGILPVTPISSEVPVEYSLEQNYPNPFNPSTKIIFSIPKSGIAKLEVFDVNGKINTRLVNEVLKPGTYEVEFDGSSFTSGVYFYRLSVGNYTKTKKLVLIK